MKKITILCAFIFPLMTVSAQTTRITAAKSWSTLSSLMGSGYVAAESILKNNGLKMSQKFADEKSGTDTYSFIPTNSTDPEYESRYFMICSSSKVVCMGISYDYDENEESTTNSDLSLIQDQVSKAGYTLKEKKTNSNNNAFSNSETDIYTYTHKTSKSEVTITYDKGMASFFMVIGESKYQALFME